MFTKVRPVGNLVPKPLPVKRLELPWEHHYLTVFTQSGTASLSLAVKAAIADRPEVKLPEVIVPAYGCPDLVSAIVAQKARPIAVDFSVGSPELDTELLKQAIGSQTIAVVAVDFLGAHERLPVLKEVCTSAGITLIEDSAQCFPPMSAQEACAEMVVLSFGRGKPINLMGGGALLVRLDKKRNVEKILTEYPTDTLRLGFGWHLKRCFFNLLMSRYLFPIVERVPFLGIGETRYRRLNGIRLLRLPSRLLAGGLRAHALRPSVASTLDRELRFIETKGWELLKAPRGSRLRYAILAPNKEARDLAIKDLNRVGIGANALYGRTLPNIVKSSGIHLTEIGEYPNATNFSERLLTLPTHDGVKAEDIENIVSTLRIICGHPKHCRSTNG